MYKLRLIISSFLVLCAGQIYAQLDSIQYLDEVLIIDSKLNEYATGFKLIQISDTIIKRDPSSLTDVLRFNSSIYFKENGYGMVSSPSFRGTNASQTAVIWNGIAINSNLTGQTDFNAISPSSFNSIIIRSGGGSTQYGSGAIGGSIHLNNNILFKEQEQYELQLLYGSFSTLGENYKIIKSTEKKYIDVGINFVSSKNDYYYLNKNYKNENGEFLRFNGSFNTGLKFKKGSLIWNSNYFYGDRNFSGTLTSSSNANYKDAIARNLVTWKTKAPKLISTLKAAHLYEQYRYFPNKNKPLFFEGKSNTYIAESMLEYQAFNKLKISSVINFTAINTTGTNIGINNRNTLAAVVLMLHQPTEKFSYGINLRKEFLNDFENPFLVSIDGKYKVNSHNSITFNASKNYRVPTFNDLYWDVGGNNELEPETSYQAEIGTIFLKNDFKFELNGFYIYSKDLIKWLPGEDAIFSPINISETENFGFELSGNYSQNFNKHDFNIRIDYAYTSAIDKEKNKQLLYVPYHKVTGLLNYNYKTFSAYYQYLYNGEVFITTDNIGTLDDYTISNVGLNMLVNQKRIPITIGIKIANIFNIYYENVAYRPMPNRNYQLNINFKL